MVDTRYTARVLAATRGGARDPLAQEGGVSHKAFIDLAGKPMLRRVVESVIDSDRVGQSIVVSVAALEQSFPDALPMIITTGDNGLHTGEIVKSFCDQLDAVTADGAL